jgi:hypothetical protein
MNEIDAKVLESLNSEPEKWCRDEWINHANMSFACLVAPNRKYAVLALERYVEWGNKSGPIGSCCDEVAKKVLEIMEYIRLGKEEKKEKDKLEKLTLLVDLPAREQDLILEQRRALFKKREPLNKALEETYDRLREVCDHSKIMECDWKNPGDTGASIPGRKCEICRLREDGWQNSEFDQLQTDSPRQVTRDEFYG